MFVDVLSLYRNFGSMAIMFENRCRLREGYITFSQRRFNKAIEKQHHSCALVMVKKLDSKCDRSKEIYCPKVLTGHLVFYQFSSTP